jgi:Flp pilus assembly protein protease CpaA
MIDIFLICLAFVWLIFASIEDLKKREVEDWVNFSLIIFALGGRFFYSLFTNDFSVLYSGLIGFAIFFILGYVFYYGKFFAGADAKLMMAFGAILPFSSNLIINLKGFVLFFFIFFMVGSIYGLSWSGFLTLANIKKVKTNFVSLFKKEIKLVYFVLFLVVLFFALGFVFYFCFLISLFFLVLPLLFVWAKSLDNVCMIKSVKPAELTEGDWLVKDISYDSKIIHANWDGLSKHEIRLLIKRGKNVFVRYGIPFIPVFLISFAIFLYFRNWVYLF